MLLDEDETQTVSTALYQYQSTIDRLKFITRNLKDAIEWQGTFEDKYHKIRRALYKDYGIVEQLDRLIEDGMMYLESTPVSELIDNLKDEFSGVPVVVENKVMDPVSFYYPLKGSIKLIGIARNREAYLATLQQIGDKHVEGCMALVGDELIEVTPEGKLEHEPKNGPVIPEDTMYYLHYKRGV